VFGDDRGTTRKGRHMQLNLSLAGRNFAPRILTQSRKGAKTQRPSHNPIQTYEFYNSFFKNKSESSTRTPLRDVARSASDEAIPQAHWHTESGGLLRFARNVLNVFNCRSYNFLCIEKENSDFVKNTHAMGFLHCVSAPLRLCVKSFVTENYGFTLILN